MLKEKIREIENVEYRTISCSKLSNEEMEQCRKLFNENYGVWGEGCKPDKIGKPICFPPRYYKEYHNNENTYVALAELNGDIIGQAFYLRVVINGNDYISWVLQLVVDKRYRHRGIAKTLLHSIWGFSGDFAWGLATSNALTVKTLEKATFRKVIPSEMMKHGAKIEQIKRQVSYAANAKTIITNDRSVIDTAFPVDRNVIEQNYKLYNDKWLLGELPIGYEWLAFTFRDQEYQLSDQDYKEIFKNSEKIVNSAYSRMNLSKQTWNKSASKEVDYILNNINAANVHSIIDWGCGNGRHSKKFAQKGYSVIGIDYSFRNIERAQKENTTTAEFICGDCRKISLDKQADLAVCLYDVVGSFTNRMDNWAIVKNIRKHLKNDGYIVLSVMNLELTRHIAKNKTKNVRKNLKALVKLQPSKTMQDSGTIFDPMYYLLEEDTGVVYRKEQFENEGDLSAEYVIRDKRYTKDEICKLLRHTGFEIVDARYVQAGKWDKPLSPVDPKAKEILVIAKKRSYLKILFSRR